MSKRIHNPALPIDYTPKQRVVTENTIPPLPPCINCNNNITDGFYGRWGNGGVCSKNCNTEQLKKPRFPEHTEQEFLQRQGEQYDLNFDQDQPT